MNLSKSKYCEGIQCKKMLWLEENRPEEAVDTSNQGILDSGKEVGIVARDLLGDHIDIPYSSDLGEMIRETKKTIEENDTCNIAEASFLFQNNFCSVDILKKDKNKYEIYEVKGSKECKDIYLEDASYQYYVLSSLGYDVEKVCIVHLNGEYVRRGELELDKLFTIVDITDIAKGKVEEIKKRIKEISEYMEQTKEPKDPIGLHCEEPYVCPFFTYCTKDLEKPNVFNVRGLWFSNKIELYQKGITSFPDLLKEKMNKKYLEQIDFEVNDREDKIEKEKIQEFLDTLTLPLYFLDFETYEQAIPKYDGESPNDKVPFQYSLHYYEKDKTLKHKEFLAQPSIDPRRSLAESLVRDIPMNVCTLAYNMSFEKKVIKKLAQEYPDLRDHLMNIHDNIKDLMIPFYRRYYYTKAMEGSYSIKYVLPALFPDDPSLNYHNLEDVHNGVEAMDAYQLLGRISKEEQEKLRENLLKYCGLDTYAMVKIYDKLIEVTEDKKILTKK